MKISILTHDSRGDVQPGIHFVPLAGEPEKLSCHINDAGRSSLKMIGGIMDYVTGIAVDVLRQTEACCQDTNLINHAFLHAVGAHTYARGARA